MAKTLKPCTHCDAQPALAICLAALEAMNPGTHKIDNFGTKLPE